MGDHRLRHESQVLVRVALPQRCRFLEGDLGRDVSRERVVRRGLVRDEVEPLAARHELGKHVRGIRSQRHGEWPPRRGGFAHPLERRIERGSLLVEVAGLEAAVDRALIDVDAEDGGARHRRSQRLRAAHPSES